MILKSKLVFQLKAATDLQPLLKPNVDAGHRPFNLFQGNTEYEVADIGSIVEK